jgi:hypothetical protein
MPSLDQSAERIIYITHTRGSGSARIEVFPAKQQDRIDHLRSWRRRLAKRQFAILNFIAGGVSRPRAHCSSNS